MSSQTPVNGQVTSPQKVRDSKAAITSSVADVLHDVTELAELQARLFASDLLKAKRRSILGVVCFAVGGCLLLGLIPVFLMGAAELLTQSTDIKSASALLMVAGCALLAAAATSAVGWIQFKGVLAELENSKIELKQNINWIKRTLKQGGCSGKR